MAMFVSHRLSKFFRFSLLSLTAIWRRVKFFWKIRSFRCLLCWLKHDILYIVFYAAKGYSTAAVSEATVDCGAALSLHSSLYIVHSQFSHLSETAVCVRQIFFFYCFQIATIWILRNVSRWIRRQRWRRYMLRRSGHSSLWGKRFSWLRPVPVNSKIHYSMRTVISWFTTKNSRDWSRLSISLSNAFRNSRACWTKIQDVWTLWTLCCGGGGTKYG